MPAAIPKGRAKGKAKAKGAAAPPVVIALPPAPANIEYHQALAASKMKILNTWPDIVEQDPLPMQAGDDGLAGFLAPFEATSFDRCLAEAQEGQRFQLQNAANFMWQDIERSSMSFVPMYLEHVLTWSETIEPGLLPHSLVFCVVPGMTGTALPKGHILRLSPDEWTHAVIFRVASRLNANCSAEEALAWKRTLLSAPCIWKYCATSDEQYAEASSLRNDIAAQAQVVIHTKRQTVYNVYGFKAMKEAATQETFGAMQLAEFHMQKVRHSTTDMALTKSSIDVCLTLYTRFFSITRVEACVVRSEKKYGQLSCWNTFWKMQESVYRCQTKPKLIWVVEGIEDQIESAA